MSDQNVLRELAAMESRLTQRIGSISTRMEERLDALASRLEHQEAIIDSIAAALLSPTELALLNGLPVTGVRAKAR
jgi:hypothetical protein